MKPAAKPATAQVPTTSHSGASSAITTKRGAPARRNVTRYVFRRGIRAAHADAQSAPIAAEPPKHAKRRATPLALPTTSRDHTGTSTVM
ncbi:hypothetical protein GCM10023349_25870 [Nocardioides conyzicola]|uniref:Uncharacterized protein n=1 Tax=Nocardioides conyzicola TaxID=1651781 RepID=A0ABP8XEG9_9ACTN